MTKKIVLCADIGTTALKVALIDETGNVLAFAKESFINPEDRFISKNWYSALCTATNKLVKKIDSNNICAMSISGNGPTLVSDDGTTLLWNKKTTAIHIEKEAAKSIFIPRIISFQKTFSEQWDNSKFIYSGPEYIIKKLTGTSITILPEKRYKSAYWTDDMLQSISIDKNKLPQYVDITYNAGLTKILETKQLGLKNQIPVFSCGPDFIAAMIGTNSLSIGKMYDCAGSSEGVNICTPNPVHEDRIRALPSVIPNLWNAAVLQTESGRMFVNYKKIFEAIAEKDVSYGELISWCLKNKNSDGFEILELIAENLKQAILRLIAIAEKNNIKIEMPIVVTGGQTKSEQWMQMKCNYTGFPLAVTSSNDAELIGNAVCAFTGIGVYKNIKEAANNLVKIKKIYTPEKYL